jgi:hypothetical protein
MYPHATQQFKKRKKERKKKNPSRVCWCTSVIPATQEAGRGGSWSKAGTGKSKTVSEKAN